MSFPWVSASLVSSRQPPAPRPSVRLQPKRLSVLIALALGGTAMAVVQPRAQALPPVVAAPAINALPRAYANEAGFAYRGDVRWAEDLTANRMTITQQSLTAIGRFHSFDVGRDASVVFDQQAGNTSQFLGRIDATGIPSRIFGTLEANGSVYLINQNGVVFGSNSQVNARSFIFSALDIRDEKFLEGFDKGVDNPADSESLKVFEWNVESAAGNNPNNVSIDFDQTYVQVLPGARITSKSGGNVLLLAPHVVNGGDIRTPQGQAILAGGAKVYLQFSEDPDLRGMLVEVDPLQMQGTTVHGSAINAVTGSIAADEGNITLAAFTVKQHGNLTATTSVRQNGSIYLKAQDGAGALIGNFDTTKNRWDLHGASNPGQLEIGNGTDTSVTEVNPVASNDTSQDGQGFAKSSIQLSGGQITFNDHSLVRAAGGDLTVSTETDKSVGVSLDTTNASTDRWIDIRSGARLDVSGTQDVEVSVSRNFIQTTPYSSELKDTPAQRDGFLYRQPLWIDVRNLPKVADFSGYLSQVERSVGERTATGGNISLTTRGQVFQRAGSSLDVSGGSIQYQRGLGRTTQLISGDKVYDIGDAPANLNYDGFARIYTRTLNKWNVTQTWGGLGYGKPLTSVERYYSGYLEGKDAGSINIIASGAALEGELAGHTISGQYQRDAVSSSAGGQFELDLVREYSSTNNFSTLDVTFSNDIIPHDPGVTPDTPLTEVTLATRHFSEGGFGQVGVTSDGGSVSVPGDVVLNVQPGGSVSIEAGRVSVEGQITTPGGEIALTTVLPTDTSVAEADIYIGPNAVLSARGLWTNDMQDPGNPFAPVVTNGGKVTLNSYGDLTLAADSQVDVSGGGWVNSSGKLQGGAGGDITLKTGDNGVAETAQRTSKLTLDGELRGYGINGGGSLSLDVGQVRIGGAPPDASAPPALLHLDEDFFQRGGFKEYTVKTRDGLTVAAGATVRAQMERLRVDSNFQLRASGADLYDFTQRELPILVERTPVELNFDAGNIEFGKLIVEAGASIATDIGGSINLNAARQIIVDGTIEAPAGAISLTLGPDGQPSYLEDQYIWLGATSRLLAQGAVQTTTDYAGLNRGEVLSGGRIALNANYGYIVTEGNSSMDVSGTSGRVDIVAPGGARTTSIETRQIASDAGEISLTAAEGMLLYGDWRAFAGGDTARGGSLNVEMTTPSGRNPTSFPTGPRRIVVSDRSGAFPTNLTASGPIESLDAAQNPATSVYNGRAFLARDKVSTGGFDSLSLRASDRIEFTESVNLSMDQRLMLDAPVIEVWQSPQGMSGNVVELSAPYLMFGNTPNMQDEGHVGGADASPGTSELRLQGQLIDLIGDTALQGVGEFEAFADSDIRLRATEQRIDLVNHKYEGRLSTYADITLQADQIYPTTMSDFTLHVVATDNPDGRVTILPGDGDSPVLSAGGRLVIDAPNIDQRGVLKAPFGEISFIAGNSLHLWEGSLTSVSGEGQLVPFGYTEGDGTNLFYDFGSGTDRQFGDGPGHSAPPEKAVRIRAESFVMDEGARVDVRGGGDLYTYEFTPGPPGRSIDILDPAARALASSDSSAVVRATAQEYEGTYAILPGLDSAFAPYDQQAYLTSGSPIPGSSVYLSGIPGLAAGVYALLPARYALLPGAFLIKQVSGYQDMTAGQRSLRPDGTYLTAGYFTSVTNPGTTVRDARTSGFEIRSADRIKYEADYGTRTLSDWIAGNGAAWQAPADAGRFVINATQSLELNGSFLGAPDTSRQGQGGQVDILGTNIVITDDVTPDDNLSDTIQVKASTLSDLDAASLLIGGERRNTASGVQVEVSATSVTVANNSDSELRAPEIMLAASDNLSLNPNSVVRASGNARLSSAPLTLTSANPNNATPGQSAFVRVASGAQVGVLRAHDLNNSGAVGDDTGTLIIGAGARLIAESNGSGQSSMILDATRSMTNSGTWRIGTVSTPGDLAIGAPRISLGAVPANAVDSGLVLSSQQLADLGDLNTLDLRSYSSIDIYGGAQLSARSNLGLEAGQIRGIDNTGSAAAIHAGQDLRFSNPNGIVATPESSAATTGTLVISAGRDLTLGKVSAVPNSGTMSIGGYQNVSLSAGRDLAVDGKGSLTVAADLALNAQRITGRSGADFEIKAQDSSTWRPIVIGAASTPWQGTSPAINDVAARLKIVGGSVTHGGVINLPSGVLKLEAMGPDGNVELLDDASIIAQGVVKQFDTQHVYAPGGVVTLSSASGDVILGDGTSIDVSGAEGGDAGGITVQAAQGEFDLKGQLRAVANARAGQDPRPAGGSFTLDVGSITDFTDNPGTVVDGFTHVNRVLQAGGFNTSRHVRVRGDNENLVLAASETITARDVRMVADAGDVDIAGDIDARGTRGGSVELWANGAVHVRDGAVIDASALPSDALPTEPGQRGGSVLLATQDTTTTGGINVESGAIIDVTGTGDQTDSGSVHVRAPRIGTAEDEVAVSALRGTVRGAGKITIEAFKVYTPAAGATLYDSINGALTEANTFMSNFSAALTTRLRNELALGGNSSGILDSLQVRSGIEIESPGSLQLDTALNLWGASSSPGVLTVRTAGNLTLNANLSDGFSTATATGVLQSGDSWSYRLVAGAEIDSADAMAVQPLNALAPSDGNFAMAANTLVRTGTGDIEIAARDDVNLASGAVIYTAGQPDIAPLANFGAPASGFRPNYPLDGGDLSIQARGDIVSAQPRNANGVAYQQVVTDWLWRFGNFNTGSDQKYLTWYPRFDLFKQGVAAFGGGDVRVAAGGDLDNFSVALPTNGRMPDVASHDNTLPISPDADNLRVLGGGDMRVTAGGDIHSGVYYLGAGTGTIQARGSLDSNLNVSRSSGDLIIPSQPLYTILALGDGQLDVSAGGSLTVQTIMNPTVFPVVPDNIRSTPFPTAPIRTSHISNFYTYETNSTTDSAVSLTAVSGDVYLENNKLAIEASSSRFNNVGLYQPGSYFSTVYPATFRAAALSGDIFVKKSLTLYPSPQGQLELFAGRSILFPSGAVGITVPDIWPEGSPTLATLLNPQSSAISIIAALEVSPVGFNAHSVNSTSGKLLHADDLEPIRIVALTGDVIGSEQGIGNFPKPLVLQAGRDLIDVGFYGQNLRDTDVTRIQAGRDLRFTTLTDPSGKLRSNQTGIFIGGPGRVEVIAGRDIDLGNSVGILTKGNINNPYLPEGGASLMALAGAAPVLASYPAFIAYYLEGGCVDEQSSYMCDLREMMRARTGVLDLSDTDALVQFNSLAPEQQTAFVNHILFSELRQTGRDAIDPQAQAYATYERGYDAIARLFPSSDTGPAPAGSINLYYSQLKTEQGGDIELLAPYGKVVAGLPTLPAGFDKSAAQLGIVTVNGGAIRAMTRDDFLVNSQRVFTLQGGDILLWSSEGNIDAGRGAKTASATPPPRLRRKSDGTVVLDLTRSISGSGIAALRANPDVTPGNVDLIAPRGTVNAGDAGIRALANLSIAAQQVLGADNIQFGGLAAGLPVADTSGLGAAAASASAAGTGKASEDAFKNTDALDDQQANLEVDVLGFGENELQK